LGGALVFLITPRYWREQRPVRDCGRKEASRGQVRAGLVVQAKGVGGGWGGMATRCGHLNS
jgi:hypothetical protein